jgi:hypothetical protein
MLIPAKIDTGADSSSIWASGVARHGETLQFVLFAPGSEYYTGQIISLYASDYRQTRVSSSFGHREVRYVVKLPVKILGRTIQATFTLADRSGRTYPVLLGRRLLKNKFLVDVTKGQPLLKEERKKRDALSIVLAELED